MQQALDGKGRIYYIDENGNKVQPQGALNPFQKVERNLLAKTLNLGSFLNESNPDSDMYKQKTNIGLALATLPIGGGVLGVNIGKTLAPFLGKKIGQIVGESAGAGLLSGGLEGFGRGLIEQKNPIKTAVQDGTIGLVAGSLGGLGVGKIGKQLAKRNLYGDEVAQTNYFNDYIADLNNKSKDMAELRRLREGLELGKSETQPLFAGENAQTADKVALNKAKEMFDNGIDNETIRQNTGWFKGVDDKWKYEISDGELKETATYDIVEDSLPLEEYHYKLNDLYDAPELYKNYPQLTETKIIFEDMPQGFNGYAMPLDNEIHLNKDMAQILNKKYVQRLEELEQTPEYKFYNENVFKNNGDYDLKVEEDFLNTPIGEEWGDLQWDNVQGLPKYINKGNDVKLKSKLSHELQHMVQDIENFAKGGSYKNPNYRNLAGEVEARTVAKRAFLKDEDRLKYSPIDGKNIFYGYDTPAKEQIVDFSYGSSLYDKLIDNTVDLTNNFDKTPTIQEVKSHIKDLIDSGKVFDTLDDDWKIDVRGGNKNIKHIANSSQYEKMNKGQRNRHNKYVMSLEDLINNSKYTNNPKANTKLDKKPNIDTYHYFETNVKIGDKKYKVILNAEQYKGESTIKPQTVHLYDVLEIK